MREAKLTQAVGKLKHDIEIGPHHLIADEPVESGGEDLGPAPTEYLAAALGACTAITAKMYAQRKGWPLENIDVRVGLVKEDDLTVFDRKVRLIGPLDKAQQERILEIVNHCPVHKILTGKIRIDTALVQ